MAACCILVAILMAQISATIRRWGIFWGIVQPEAGEVAETLLGRLRLWLARPRVRAAMFALAAVEGIAVGGWAYVVHGEHLYELGDEAVGRLTGHPVVYAPACNPQQRGGYVRLVLGRDGRTGAGGGKGVSAPTAGVPIL